MVAPRLAAAVVPYRVTLPAGDWYDTETLDLVPGGAREIAASATDTVRLFARAGAIIPEGPVVQNASQLASGALALTVWPGAECSGSLYWDDGQSFAFRAGKSRRLQFACEVADSSISVQSSSVGDYPGWWQTVRVVIHAVPRPPQAVLDENGAKVPYDYDAAKRTLVVSVPRASSAFRLVARW